MKVLRVMGHAVVLTLFGTLAIFINASSPDRPLGRQANALLPMIRENRPYLLKGLDLSPEGIGARLLPIRLQGQDLAGMDLREARFPSRGLRNIRLRGAHLARADFSCVALENVDFSGADLGNTLFDYSNCNHWQQTHLCPQIDGERLAPCSIIQVDLKGTDLSGSLLQGRMNSKGSHTTPGPGQFCDHWLVINGDLQGARLKQATLRCVVLNNHTSPQPASPSQSSPPAYAGISFVSSTLENVILNRGNFVFSDFWQARVVRMLVNLPFVDLLYSSMADLRCPPEGCELWVPAPASHKIDSRLSINVRGSRIRSNLVLGSSSSSWPALMCDGSTSWKPMGEKGAEAASTVTPPSIRCEPSSGLLVLEPTVPAAPTSNPL